MYEPVTFYTILLGRRSWQESPGLQAPNSPADISPRTGLKTVGQAEMLASIRATLMRKCGQQA
jgi:hypothetical protein